MRPYGKVGADQEYGFSVDLQSLYSSGITLLHPAAAIRARSAFWFPDGASARSDYSMFLPDRKNGDPFAGPVRKQAYRHAGAVDLAEYRA
ncbi:hypothetical protein D3C87_2018530 [compost metagenome]